MITLSDIILAKPDTMKNWIPERVFDQAVYAGYPDAHEHYTWYYAVSACLQPKRILEIGVLTGLSMAAMLLGSPKARGEGWDNEEYHRGILTESMENLGDAGVLGRCDLIHKDSQKQGRYDMARWDLMHIDGDHSYQGALNDMNLSVGSCPNILVHDYDGIPTVRAAVDYWMDWHKKTIKNVVKIPARDGLILIQS